MIVTVHLFARAKDLAGKEMVKVEIPPKATIAALREKLTRDYPALQSLLERSALAMDNEFADDEKVIPEGSEIALLPPVSGG